MNELLSQAKILICVGTGGVGKTTVSSGLAALAASQGRKVLVLTVDPSKRLKQTLGIDDSGEAQRIPLEGASGELWGAVMNPQKTFDDFVRKAAGQSPRATRILENKLYQQLTTTLSGSQEFTALENLYAAAKSGRYDLIVLDTPPAQHAMDFLRAPQKLASIFSEGVAKWFRDPEGKSGGLLSGLFQSGTKQVLRVLETLTGSEFMGQLSEFFSHVQNWQGELEKRAVESHRLLVEPNTHFLLITGFDEAKFREAENFAREIKKGGYRLSALVVNRAHPIWFQKQRDGGHSLSPVLNRFRQELVSYYEERRKKIRSLQSESKSLFETLEIPERSGEISNPREVQDFAELIGQTLAENSKGKEGT